MRIPIGITRHGAIAELTSAIRGVRKASQERRLRALLAVAKGEHVPRVAKTLSVAERAVRNWVHRYNRGGLDGLRDGRSGRKCRLSPAQLARVRARLLAAPRLAGRRKQCACRSRGWLARSGVHCYVHGAGN